MKSIMSIENISKDYGKEKILKGVSLTIAKDTFVAILGPSGSGKSTLMHLLNRLYELPEGQGSILLDGVDTHGMDTMKVNRAGIARTFQNIRLFQDLSVEDNVKVGMDTQMRYNMWSGILRLPGYWKEEKVAHDRALELLSLFNMEDLADVKAGSLPYGAQRRLEIVRALATNPSLLLLDEPAAGMNPQETQELMNTIRFVRDEFHMTILLIEHDMKLVSGICEKLTVLNFGQILTEGETSEVLNDPKVITAYLGE